MGDRPVFWPPSSTQIARLRALRERQLNSAGPTDVIPYPLAWTADAVQEFLDEHDSADIWATDAREQTRAALELRAKGPDAFNRMFMNKPMEPDHRVISDNERVVYASAARYQHGWACGWCNDSRPHVHGFRSLPVAANSSQPSCSTQCTARTPTEIEACALEPCKYRLPIDTSDIPEADEDWFSKATWRVPPGYKP